LVPADPATLPCGKAFDGAPLRLVFYADDFTGATDTLATLARAGQRAMLFLRVPSAQQRTAAGPLDCLGIAGATRSMSCRQLQAELGAIGDHFATYPAPVFHYKTCSTFDSSPLVGNIGLAVRTLKARLPVAATVPIVGGQPNLGRYCVFGNLFAAFQVGGEVFRLDRHPTMSRHPVTPTEDADLRRHLARQGLKSIASVHYPEYAAPFAELTTCLSHAAEASPDALLLDVAAPENLAPIGKLLWQRAQQQPLLVVGPSSVEQALLTQWPAARSTVAPDAGTGGRPSPPGAPTLVFSGSLSPRTAKQIHSAKSYLRVPVPIDDVMDGPRTARAAIRTRIIQGLSAGHHVLAHWVDHPSAPDPRQDPLRLAQAGARILADVLHEIRPGRLGLSGGDTSSHCMQALEAWGLSYLQTLEPGVALCRLHSDSPALDGLEIMLKGGQMGSDLVFEKLLTDGPPTR
jgi:uncharacterized protein YgbK (DUF1537 family)